MQFTFNEWTSVIQILTFILGALGVVTGLRVQVSTLAVELKKNTNSNDDMRREIAHLDRRLAFLEGQEAVREKP